MPIRRWLRASTFTAWLNWQGYLLAPLGLGSKASDGTWSGDWVYANLGVLAALLIGFVGSLLLCSRRVRQQESVPEAAPASAPT